MRRRLGTTEENQLAASRKGKFVATPDARELLVALAKGAPASPLTSESKAVLERLAGK